MTRRAFLLAAGAGAVLAGAGALARDRGGAMGKRTQVALVRTADRAAGVARAIDLLQINPVRGQAVLLKPNFNTADPYPGSTHNDTLEQLILKLKAMGAAGITLGERSGPPATAEVMREKGVPDLCARHGVGIIDFETLPPDGWVHFAPAGSHWRNGFDVARPVAESPCVVATCCLKTHAYGGVFTMSLKLSVGVTHKRNMGELHSSLRSMRRMIAEINTAFAPKLILLDGIEAFTDGGPDRGARKRAGVMLAGTDRVAIDAVGVAVLKDLGSNMAIMGRKIFEQEQISRAVELGLGAAHPRDIDIVTDDAAGGEYAMRLKEILAAG